MVAQASTDEHSPHVENPLPVAQARISHIEHQPNFAPSVRQPWQLIVSAVISGELFISAHFPAVSSRMASSSLSVAIRASHFSQSSPQHAIKLLITVNRGD